MRRSWWLAALLGVGTLPCAAAAEPLRAQGERAQALDVADAGPKLREVLRDVSAEILVLHATNSKKGIDERIGKMPELKKPPFSAYDSYELLSKTRVALKKDDPKTLKLPNGRVLQTRLLDVLPKEYLRISASINQPGGKDFLPLLEVKAKVGQAFIVAGQSYKNGILVLVIRVVK
jgi:hypothetical protein